MPAYSSDPVTAALCGNRPQFTEYWLGVCVTWIVLFIAAAAAGCGGGGRANRGETSAGVSDVRAVALPAGVPGADEDGDGLADEVEDALAERFAPVVYHAPGETSYPVSVDWWLARTHLSVRTESGEVRRVASGPLGQSDLLGRSTAGAGSRGGLTSDGTRSRLKSASYFLENVARDVRGGQADTRGWITYVHSYPNRRGGVTLQYWRAYAWNDARLGPVDLGHGGDWEGIAVHLGPSQRPERVTFLEHQRIVDQTGRVRWEDGRPVIRSGAGGHSSYPLDSREASSGVRQETWTGGRVIGAEGRVRGPSGGLVNVGEKTRPRNGQVFIRYSGLWGLPGRLFITSGYWGPAFNETGARCADGTAAYGRGPWVRAGRQPCRRLTIVSWCDEAGGTLDLEAECHPLQDVP